MVELTHVINSTSIEQPDPATATDCPRTMLGLSCISREYPPCLCDMVQSTALNVTEDQAGRPVLVTLTMHTGHGGNNSAGAILAAVELTGLVADMSVERGSVQGTFNLRRPQNRDLQDLMTRN